LGSYVAAVCFYTTLFQKDPLEIPWTADFGVSESDAELINEVVKIVVFDNLGEWNIESNDIDDDGVCNNLDNCPEVYNPLQEDFNFDDIGDACDGIGIYEIIKNKNLIKTIDILGRDSNTKGLHIEIYDDGSVEKKYFLK
jgi:hypothetical protein